MLREMQFIFKDGYLLTHVFLYVCPVLLIIGPIVWVVLQRVKQAKFDIFGQGEC